MLQQEMIACRKVFAESLLDLAKNDKDIVVVTTDARGSASVDIFAQELPEQFIEVGIAEQNAIGIAAGLAIRGKKPFVCGPACFLSARSLDQVKVDVAYSNTNVKIIGVSGGVSYGPLGGTHHCLHDIATMRTFPGLSIILPCDANQARQMAKKLVEYKGPVYVRMGRNPVQLVYSDNAPFEIGKANILLEGEDLTIISTGEMVRHALDAALILKNYNIFARVIDMHTIKPVDTEVVLKAAKETKIIITVEEHSIFGGLGAAITEIVSKYNPTRVEIMGIPDENVITGKPNEILNHYGLTADKIAKRILSLFKVNV